MILPNGTFVGPYEIVAWLGAGGMGVVYRARDSRLGREVAIKMIPEAAALDVSRVERFEQEARAAGQLNHPNIVAVYDVGTDAGTPYIVSELLDGESLRQLLARGALPSRKAIDYARQIAEGLAAAHDKAIVHRDVKPDNLFVTYDGRVKILDFGIAKLIGPGDDPAPHVGSPTDTAPGTVVGSVGYMSPEQVRGEIVDTRSDIFSCGTVLYEMLTGRPAFTRVSVAEAMVAVLNEEPPQPLPPTVPPSLARIVSRCLEKARQARFQSARDLAFSLEGLSGTDITRVPDELPGARGLRWYRRSASPWVVAGALALGLALGALRGTSNQPVPSGPNLRLSMELGAAGPLRRVNAQFGGAVTLSADGSAMAFVAQEGEAAAQIYLRRFDQLEAVPLSGSGGALAPFFSRDGRWIGFFASGKLKKIAVTGGAAISLADAPSQRGGTWSPDGTIVFSPDGAPGTRLMRVSSDGGPAEAITSLVDGETVQFWPQVLPGGKAVLYTSGGATGTFNDARLIVQPLPTGMPKVVQRGAFHGRYLASGQVSPGGSVTDGGHLVYIRDGTLFAAPFDLTRMEVTGLPVPALEGVASNALTGGAQFSASDTGMFVYLPGAMVGGGTPFGWMNADGKTSALPPAHTAWLNVRFAPDGRRLALEIREGQSAIWILDWARESLMRLTLDQADSRSPVWTPDGLRITFSNNSAGRSTPNLYWQRVDGAGDAQRLTNSTNLQVPGSWHPSGQVLAFEEATPTSDRDLMILPLTGNDAKGWTPGTPRVFVGGPTRDVNPSFSPDGRWLAYASNESGRMEVYVRPFPGPGGKWLVSTGGGSHPVWSRTKPELFFAADDQMMVASYTVEGNAFRAGRPRLWSEGRFQTRGPNRMFDLHPDGERFALAPAASMPGRSRPDTVVFIVNFFDELRRVAASTLR